MSLRSKQLIYKCLIIFLVSSKQINAIIVGEHQGQKNSIEGATSNLTFSGEDVDKSSSSVGQQHRTGEALDGSSLSSNTTFYYDPNAFLINKKQANSSSNSEQQAENDHKPKNSRLSGSKSYANLSLPEPASLAMTSGRSGRMLDLDALMGDFAAAQANRNRNNRISGNRQSRFLNQPQQGHTLEVTGGKKLHIQGFIPIVGVKDVSDESENERDNINNASQLEALTSAAMKQQRPKLNDLPYEQSSMGHASFGVQRYLNSGDQGMGQQLMHSASLNQPSHVEAKYNSAGSSMLDTLKKPLKKLTDFGGGESQQQQQQQNQNCLCVPFYMCKNGFISESSLGKAQIQQMIAQQQQLMSVKQQQNSDQIEMKSGQPITSAPELLQLQQPHTQLLQTPQYKPDSYVQIDERSFDRDLVTMSSLVGGFYNRAETDAAGAKLNQSSANSVASNQNDVSAEPPPTSVALNDDQAQSAVNNQATNGTDQAPSAEGNQDYSQEILGRMLGLKSSSQQQHHWSKGNSGSSNIQSSTTGVCGLLRSCCQIPLNLLPSQQDAANDQFMAQYGTSLMNKYQQSTAAAAANKPMYGQSTELIPQQMVALQKYQPGNKQLPYGFPARTQQQQMMMMQPLNLPEASLMTHRSNQFNNQLLSQYTRGAMPMQQMQSFQQQQQQHQMQQPMQNSLQASTRQNLAQSGQQLIKSSQLPAGSLLGTRKILDGRCGIRQSAGITGRVQTLQYHESSADFGEYPAQAAILKRLGGTDSLFVCGGTLISQYWVATAAHCIKKHSQSDLKIRLGEWDVHRDDEFYPYVEKQVRDLIIHPEFVAGNLVNDIALLRLDSPVDPSLPHVNPACLPMLDESFARQRCWVTGWGKDSFGQKGSFQAVLREVELPVMGQGECEQALRQTRLGAHYRLHSGFICAGGEGGRDACEGDGGSGLYCHQDGVTKVAGLVSWGIGCGQAGVPGVYVSMAHYRPWIENIISIDEDIYSPDSNMIASSLISERNSANTTSTANGTNESQTETTTKVENK